MLKREDDLAGYSSGLLQQSFMDTVKTVTQTKPSLARY